MTLFIPIDQVRAVPAGGGWWRDAPRETGSDEPALNGTDRGPSDHPVSVLSAEVARW